MTTLTIAAPQAKPRTKMNLINLDPDQMQNAESDRGHHCLLCIQASVAQLDAPSDWRPGGRGINPHRGRQHSFVEIDHEIFSTVILSLPLIQEGQLSFWRKNVHNTG